MLDLEDDGWMTDVMFGSGPDHHTLEKSHQRLWIHLLNKSGVREVNEFTDPNIRRPFLHSIFRQKVENMQGDSWLTLVFPEKPDTVCCIPTMSDLPPSYFLKHSTSRVESPSLSQATVTEESTAFRKPRTGRTISGTAILHSESHIHLFSMKLCKTSQKASTLFHYSQQIWSRSLNLSHSQHQSNLSSLVPPPALLSPQMINSTFSSCAISKAHISPT